MRRGESGQGSVENLLVISVIAIAVVGAGYVFVPTFGSGVEGLSADVSSILGSGTIGGTGTSRGGSGVGGTGTDGSGTGGSGAGGFSGPLTGGVSPDGLDTMEAAPGDSNDVTTIGHTVGCHSPLGCTQAPQGSGNISND